MEPLDEAATKTYVGLAPALRIRSIAEVADDVANHQDDTADGEPSSLGAHDGGHQTSDETDTGDDKERPPEVG